MRLLYSVMALALAGCALETALPPGDDLTREPDFRAILARNVGSIVGDPSKLGELEISGAWRADSVKGYAWQVCLRSNIYSQPKYYAAFIQNEKIANSRLAVVLDQCERQSYTQFNEWIAATRAARDADQKSDRGRR